MDDLEEDLKTGGERGMLVDESYVTLLLVFWVLIISLVVVVVVGLFY